MRAAQPVQLIWNRVVLAWLALTALAAAAFGVAVLVARRQARHLSAPLETLAKTSEQIAAGDLTVRAEPSGIPEIGRVAETHNAMVDKLDDMLERERHFTANASHQLRTRSPVFSSAWRLPKNKLHETPASTCDQRCRKQTIRPRSCIAPSTTCFRSPAFPSDQWAAADPVPLDDVLVETERRWHGPLAKQGRRLSLRRPQDMAIAKVPGRVVGQILDILLDNPSGHGLGAVTVTARDIGDAVAIDVADEGFLSIPMTNLFTRESGTGVGHGIGLGLAGSLAEACGGRLHIASEAPTTFSLVLPLNPDDDKTDA